MIRCRHACVHAPVEIGSSDEQVDMPSFCLAPRSSSGRELRGRPGAVASGGGATTGLPCIEYVVASVACLQLFHRAQCAANKLEYPTPSCSVFLNSLLEEIKKIL
jgi:hypothetical protein